MHSCKLSLYTISRKTNEPNRENGKKPSFGSDFDPFDPNSGRKIFFSKVMVNYHHVQYQEKLMIQSSENLVTDGQTDESDFKERCSTNVQRPK